MQDKGQHNKHLNFKNINLVQDKTEIKSDVFSSILNERDHDLIDGSSGMRISYLEKHQPKTSSSNNFYGDILLSQLDKFYEKITINK